MDRVKMMTGIKTLLILPVAVFHFSVVSKCIRADELVANYEFSDSGFKQSKQIFLTIGKTVGEFKAIVGLDTFDSDVSAGIPFDQFV